MDAPVMMYVLVMGNLISLDLIILSLFFRGPVLSCLQTTGMNNNAATSHSLKWIQINQEQHKERCVHVLL